MKDDLLQRIKELEKRVAYLENKPAEYVPPPTYGPLPKLNNEVPEIIFSQEQSDALNAALDKIGIKTK